MLKKPRAYVALIFLGLWAVLLSGCSLLYKGTGNTLIAYAEDEAVPYILATGDINFSCAMVESFAPFLFSFSRVSHSPDQLAILFYLMAGSCTEFKAWEEELRYLRAVYAGNPVAARDARIAQQRYLSQVAHTQWQGYKALALRYAEPGGECPLLTNDNAEFYWLMGLISGLQALLNDIASAGDAHVPLDIGAKIGRAVRCLNNDKWWGVPEAIQASLWLSIPGHQPADKQPMQILHQALQTGSQQGITISHVLAVQVHSGLGHTEKVKQIIRQQSQAKISRTEHPGYQLLNQMAYLQMQQFSDRLWTAATGSRTPIGEMGSFWDDPVEHIDIIEIDDIL